MSLSEVRLWRTSFGADFLSEFKFMSAANNRKKSCQMLGKQPLFPQPLFQQTQVGIIKLTAEWTPTELNRLHSASFQVSVARRHEVSQQYRKKLPHRKPNFCSPLGIAKLKCFQLRPPESRSPLRLIAYPLSRILWRGRSIGGIQDWYNRPLPRPNSCLAYKVDYLSPRSRCKCTFLQSLLLCSWVFLLVQRYISVRVYTNSQLMTFMQDC